MGVYNTCLTCLFCIHNVFLFHNTLISNVVANHCVVYIVVAEFLLSWRSHLPLDGETGVNQLSLRIPYILPPCEHLAAYLQIECLLKKQTQYANLSLHSTLFVHLVSLREWNVFISLSSLPPSLLPPSLSSADPHAAVSDWGSCSSSLSRQSWSYLTHQTPSQYPPFIIQLYTGNITLWY